MGGVGKVYNLLFWLRFIVKAVQIGEPQGHMAW